MKSRLWCSEDDEDFKCVHAPTTPLGSVRSLAYYRSVPLVVTQEGLYPETQVALTRKGRSKSSLRLGLSITKQESNPFFKLTAAKTENRLPWNRSCHLQTKEMQVNGRDDVNRFLVNCAKSGISFSSAGNREKNTQL